MIENQFNSETLISDVKKLKVLLIVLTIIQVGYLIFSDTKLLMKLDLEYKIKWLVWGLHLLTALIFIGYNWKKMPIDKNSKTNNTYMILFMGIIGMWLWIPNKRELNKLTEK